MLAQKLKTNDIVVLKFMSGEEVLGRFQSEDDNTITLTKAFTIILQNTPQGRAIGLTPAVLIADPEQEHPYRKAALVITIKPPLEHPVVQAYQQQTSGIVQAPSSLISSLGSK